MFYGADLTHNNKDDMDEQQMRAECAKIESEFGAVGLAGGTIYEDFAVELAKRVQAAERERIAMQWNEN